MSGMDHSQHEVYPDLGLEQGPSYLDDNVARLQQTFDGIQQAVEARAREAIMHGLEVPNFEQVSLEVMAELANTVQILPPESDLARMLKGRMELMAEQLLPLQLESQRRLIDELAVSNQEVLDKIEMLERQLGHKRDDNVEYAALVLPDIDQEERVAMVQKIVQDEFFAEAQRAATKRRAGPGVRSDQAIAMRQEMQQKEREDKFLAQETQISEDIMNLQARVENLMSAGIDIGPEISDLMKQLFDKQQLYLQIMSLRQTRNQKRVEELKGMLAATVRITEEIEQKMRDSLASIDPEKVKQKAAGALSDGVLEKARALKARSFELRAKRQRDKETRIQQLARDMVESDLGLEPEVD